MSPITFQNAVSCNLTPYSDWLQRGKIFAQIVDKPQRISTGWWSGYI